jgi:hypothetical protein
VAAETLEALRAVSAVTQERIIQTQDSKPEPIVVSESGKKKVNRGRNHGKMGRPEKIIGEFDDILSSGRKRAANLFKIEPGQVCEWSWKKFNGGGIVPVFGCTGLTARHIHHGPDKSTFNNDRDTNISLICTFCHQLWHVRNDKYYEEPRPEDGSAWLPYAGELANHRLDEAIEATLEETIDFEISIGRELSVADWARIRDEQQSRSTVEHGPEGRPTENESQ